MNNTKVSIICPLYNKIDFVEETIQSVVNQTASDWEFLIIDDGSTDGCDAIAIRWSQVDKRIKFLRRMDHVPSRKGGSVCRNIGIENASGQYVLFLDADDLMHSKCIERRVEYALSTPSSNLIIFNHNYFTHDVSACYKDNITEMFNKVFSKIAKNKKLFCQKHFLSNNLLWTISNPLWKTDFLRIVGGFDESFPRLQDPEVHSKALLNSALNLDFHYFESQPDVHIRMASNRHAGTALDNINHKYEIIYESITMYLIKFSGILDQEKEVELKKYFQGYIFFYQCNVISSRQKLAISDAVINSNVSNLFNIIGKEHRDRKYRLGVRLYSIFFNNIIFRKLKLHTITYKMFYYL